MKDMTFSIFFLVKKHSYAQDKNDPAFDIQWYACRKLFVDSKVK